MDPGPLGHNIQSALDWRGEIVLAACRDPRTVPSLLNKGGGAYALGRQRRRIILLHYRNELSYRHALGGPTRGQGRFLQ